MPSRWTFQIRVIRDFVERNLAGRSVVVDPFAGQSTFGTLRNDLAESGIESREWLRSLDVEADAVLFDPPYSPRQIAECYKGVGRTVTTADTQNALLYSEVMTELDRLLKPGGVALSFGWRSSGFGKRYKTTEILLVQHGGAHNDTICVAQVKPRDIGLFSGEATS
jgi:hypothetical protein